MLEQFGSYALLEHIGDGGMAEVFTAEAPDGSRVVIKRMLAHLEQDPDNVAMFVDEGRLGQRLNLPGIVKTLDVGIVTSEERERHYLALEHIDGADLGAIETRAREGSQPLPLPICAFICARVAEALHTAHVAVDPSTGVPLQVVHRDISPSNVLVSRTGAVKVADFGVARSSVQEVRTATGVLKGKISYMSPEQLDSAPIDLRSDVYSLGVMLYGLVARRRLYKGLTDVQTIRLILESAVPPPSRDNPSVDEELDHIVMRALQREPDKRYQTAQELAQALDRFAQPRGGTAEAFQRLLRGRPHLFTDGFGAIPPTSPERPGSGLRRVATPSEKGGLKLKRKGDARPRELLLYVEDEDENREVAALRLRRNYDLLLAPDDVTACAILRESGDRLAAVLMDIQLKGSALDGIQLTRLLRGTLPQAELPPHARNVPVLKRLPVLFVTAYGARYTETELVAAGGNKLINKPVNFSELMLALVAVHLGRATGA